jgi:DNA polymerase IV
MSITYFCNNMNMTNFNLIDTSEKDLLRKVVLYVFKNKIGNISRAKYILENFYNEKEIERPNEGLILTLKQMAKDYAQQGDPMRSKSYNNAASSLRGFNENIIGTKGKKVVFETQTVKVAGVGDKILAKIQKYLDTGEIPQAVSLHEKVKQSKLISESRKTEREKAIEQFEAIYQIGKKKAAELWNAGYHSLDDLRKNPKILNAASAAYLESYDDLQLRIKRDNIIIFEKLLHFLIRERFGKKYRMMLAGSYARGAPESGDIDILIESSTFTIKELTKYLEKKNIIIKTLLLGAEKMHAIAQCPNTISECQTGVWHRFRLDIHFVQNPSSWATSVLYFTSGVDFNRWIRGLADRKGWTLSDKGLFDEHGEKIQTETEEDIFSLLGQNFVEIKDR